MILEIPMRVERHSMQHQNKSMLSWDSSLPRAGVNLEARGAAEGGGIWSKNWGAGWGPTLKGHGVLGKEESECLAKNCPGYVCVCTRVLTVAFRTRDNWKNMTDAEPHAFGDMWLQFWDCLSFLISGKQEDQKEKKKKKKKEEKKKKKTASKKKHRRHQKRGYYRKVSVGPGTLFNWNDLWGPSTYPKALLIFALWIHTVSIASPNSRPSSIWVFTRQERESGTFPTVCRKGVGGAARWGNGGCITGKLETFRETPRNPSLHYEESLVNLRRPNDLKKEGPAATDFQLRAGISAPLASSW